MTTIELLGKYEIRATLGQGAMGTVYDGWDPIIARRVAIKTVHLPPNTDMELHEEIARFRREAQAAGRLNHPNIVGVFDYGETEKVAFIVMEFVDGRTLKQALEAGERMTPPEIADCMENILAGMQYSHDRGVVHRDIKPANIMLTREGQAKIADFGIARIENSNLTQAGTVLGTPAYMSPEQFSGQVVDLRTDIYSSGVLLYQLLTGERPFDGSMTAIMHKVLNTAPPKPSDLSVTCPKPFDEVVARAMAKRPDDRYPNARAFADAIHAAIVERPVPPPILQPEPAPDESDRTMIAPAKVSPLPQAAAEPVAPKPVVSPPATTSSAPEKRKSPVPLIGAGVAALGIAAGVAYFVMSGHDRAAQPVETKTATSEPAPWPAGVTPVKPRSDVQPVKPAAAFPTPPIDLQPAGPPSPQPPINEAMTQTPPVSVVQPTVTPTVVIPPVVTPPTPVVTPPTVDPKQAAPQYVAPVVTPETPPEKTPEVVQPPTPPRPAASSSRESLAHILSNSPCALVNSEANSASEGIAITGIAGSSALSSLQSAVVSALGGTPISWRVGTFDGPYCDALETIRRVAGKGGGGVLAKPNRPFLRDDDLLTIDVTLPEYPAHLVIDYLSSDGSVSHLVPTTTDVKNHFYPDRLYSARERETFGKPVAPGYNGLRVGDPFGTDMIIVVASATQLLPVKDSQSEDKAGPYLSQLQAAIATARSHNAKVTATAFVLEVAPKQ